MMGRNKPMMRVRAMMGTRKARSMMRTRTITRIRTVMRRFSRKNKRLDGLDGDRDLEGHGLLLHSVHPPHAATCTRHLH